RRAPPVAGVRAAGAGGGRPPPPLTVVRADPAPHRGPDARVTITSRSCLLSVLPIVDACARLDARDAD
ncbi:hypothetical protein, partial [Nocardia cyriacigeorgica]|uniref:hypothetical protein n=1 Tax=Nocardia cyriacigeorgica TaxID=135487 RepID=UPI00245626DA